MAKLRKRGYPAKVYRHDNKWYTGYQQPYGSHYEAVIETDKHEVREMELQYVDYQRGRSAANIELQDRDGFKYLMSMSGFHLLMTITDGTNEKIKALPGSYDIFRRTCHGGAGVWFCGSFCQTKQGQNYFIEPAEV